MTPEVGAIRERLIINLKDDIVYREQLFMSVPFLYDGSSSIMPEFSSLMPSSFSEQHIPSDSYPATIALPISPATTLPPAVAKATF